MTPDELAVMDGGKCILQVQGIRPFFSDKFDITKHPQYKYLSDADPKNTFNVAEFLKCRLKVRPEDKQKEIILSKMQPDKKYKVEEVAVWLDVGRTRARNLLKLLVEDGRIVETGTTKMKRYCIL